MSEPPPSQVPPAGGRGIFGQLKGWGGTLSGILVGVLGSLLLFRPFLFVRPGGFLWGDNFDAKLIYWTVNWGYHILFEARQPLSFWNANAFYPAPNALAFSDSILGLQLFFAPLRALHLGPLVSLYGALILLTLSACFFTARALPRILPVSALETAILVFAAHFSLSLTGFLYHYQLFGFQFAPGFFLYLYLYLRDFQKKDLLIAASLFSLGMLVATYLGPMLLVLSIFLALYCLIARAKQIGPGRLLARIGWFPLLVGVLFGGMLYLVQIRPYLGMSEALTPSAQSYSDYSASLTSLFANFSIHSYWYSPVDYLVYGQWEHAYFPGYALLVAAGLWLLWGVGRALLRLLPYRWASPPGAGEPPNEERIFWGYMLVLLFLLLLFSLGPVFKDFQNISAFPYAFLQKVIPGMINIRAPGRFGAWIGLPLAAFGLAFFRRLHLPPAAKSWLRGAFFLILVVESLPVFPLYPFSVDPDGAFRRMRRSIQAGEVVLVLPVFGKDHYDTIANVQNQLVGSTIGWPTLLVGYGAKTTPVYDRLLYLDSLAQRGDSIQPVLDLARENQVAALLVYLPAYPGRVIRQWEGLAAQPSACLIFEEKGYLLLRLNRQDCPANP